MSAPVKPLRIAVLVKQIPRFEQMSMTADGRLNREGVELDLNAYCRRAVAKGVELARATGGTTTAYTLGPPSAEEVLREAIACGADQGVLIADPAFAGSDTLATARALAAALERGGPFDLVLCGRNSLDADTGQVPPEVAELLGLPFLCSARELELEGRGVRARLELDDGFLIARAPLPLLVSTAERLCAPAKAEPEARAAVPAERIRRLDAAALGPGPWGLAGSPTRVGETRLLEQPRLRRRFEGPVRAQVEQALELLRARGALSPQEERYGESVPQTGGHGPVVAVLIEPGDARLARELCGEGARLAAALGGQVVALAPDAGETADAGALGGWGADRAIRLEGAAREADGARAVLEWIRDEGEPWALLAPSTVWGREVASRIAARLGAGLTGDAVELEVREGRLVAWKPAFGGQLVAAIATRSPLQMATVRPGVLPLARPRGGRAELVARAVEPRSPVEALERIRDDDVDALARAEVVIGVGMAIEPGDYPLIEPLRRLLGAELAATRKVTDRGWLPRSRQVGITGQSIAPRLYIGLGVSGKFNHSVGLRGAGTVLAVNADPEALIFDVADAGVVGDWREALAALTEALADAPPGS